MKINLEKEISSITKQIIEKYKPEKIILFGKSATQAFLLGRDSVKTIEMWVGNAIPDQKYKCWVFPTYHPVSKL